MHNSMGFSFGTVLNTLSSIYLGEDLPAPLAYADVINFNASKKSESLTYWKSQLNGSPSPTWSLNSSAPTTYSPEDRLVIERTIAMPQVQTEGVLPATLFHAACTLVLGAHYSEQEMIFGRLVTGRSMLPTILQVVVSPILTEVPLRVRLKGDNTVQSLSGKLQDRFIEDSKHEASGMVEIIRYSTEWAAECEDFGWRTSFQQGDETDFSFLGEASKFAF
ncbi:Hypothetical protein R9X50_00104500 [Acrodontium crateriforme]|uniref:Condensation domain-containing protein n=1 Tax=Acrodontium crateriforme TaxID=150365 RepID=A0AAQ3R9Q2_9PEZI|nr:Hypothetical protein R9X50_00104500 [Acrodontium crateriforme]